MPNLLLLPSRQRCFVCLREIPAFLRSYRTPGAVNLAKSKSRIKLLTVPSRPLLESIAKANEALEIFDKKTRPKARKVRKWLVPTLMNKDQIDQTIDFAGLAQYAGKTILEMNPGPGLLAERILEKVKPAKYIALEYRKQFIESLGELEGTTKDGTSIDIDILHKDGFAWQVYKELEADGTLEFDKLVHPRDEINPNLVFVATAPRQIMDQLVAQWIDTLGTTSWLQKFGRVRMYLFVTHPIRQRLLAYPGSPFRTKGTFVREATCEIREILHNPFVQDAVHESGRLLWKQDFNDMAQADNTPEVRPDHFFPPAALSLLEVNPYEKSKITAPWETFEFIAKSLLMNKSTPLHQQIRSLASGAYVLLEKLAPELRQKWPQDMTVEEMNDVAVAFTEWPFKPRFLHNEPFDQGESRGTRRYGQLIRERVGTHKPVPTELSLPDGSTTPLTSDPPVDAKFEHE